MYYILLYCIILILLWCSVALGELGGEAVQVAHLNPSVLYCVVARLINESVNTRTHACRHTYMHTQAAHRRTQRLALHRAAVQHCARRGEAARAAVVQRARLRRREGRAEVAVEMCGTEGRAEVAVAM